MGLTSRERYSTGQLKRGILCACQHFVSERVGVLAEYGGVVVRLPLGLRSLTLLRCLSRHSSLVLCFCLNLEVMAPKACLTGKSQAKVAVKKTREKSGGPCLQRCWAELHELHAVLLLGLDTCAKLDLIRPPLQTRKLPLPSSLQTLVLRVMAYSVTAVMDAL